MTRSPILLVCGALAGFMALSASAEPPSYSNHSRVYGNWVEGGSCSDIPNGYRCRSVQATENYDVKGTFQYTNATFTVWRDQYDPSDGSWVYTWRYLTCPVDQKAISAHPNKVTLSATLYTDGPGCDHWGYTQSWDPVNGYQWSEAFFSPGPREIEAEWADPFSYGSSMSNQKDTYFDGWSGTTTKYVNHCKFDWGDMMNRGGFTITSPVRTNFYPFEGPDGPAWSYYNVSSCNTNDMQR